MKDLTPNALVSMEYGVLAEVFGEKVKQWFVKGYGAKDVVRIF